MADRNANLPPPDAPDSAGRYVFVRAARCRNPACRSRNLLAYRTTRSADGSVARHSKCRDCGKRCIVVET